MATKKRAAKQSKVKRPTAEKRATRKAATKKTTKKTTKKATKKSANRRTSQSDADTAVREISLAFPEAHEVEAWGSATYRVKNKLFAMYIPPDNHHHRGRPAVWIYSTHVEQDLVVRARPALYFKPPYVGPSGWIGAFLDGTPPWLEITELLREAYRRRAPKKLAALLDE